MTYPAEPKGAKRKIFRFQDEKEITIDLQMNK